MCQFDKSLFLTRPCIRTHDLQVVISSVLPILPPRPLWDRFEVENSVNRLKLHRLMMESNFQNQNTI